MVLLIQTTSNYSEVEVITTIKSITAKCIFAEHLQEKNFGKAHFEAADTMFRA